MRADLASDELQALVALYQAERSDSSAILNIALALIGAGAAYVVGTVAFSDQFCNSVRWVFVALSPLPLWLVSAFHSLIFTLGAVHGLSSQFLEEQLFKRSGIDPRYRSVVGSLTGENVMNPMRSPYPQMVAAYITYGGAGLVVIGYTMYAIYISWNKLDAWIYLFLAGYLLLFAAVLSSWVSGIRTVAKNWAASGLLQERSQRW